MTCGKEGSDAERHAGLVGSVPAIRGRQQEEAGSESDAVRASPDGDLGLAGEEAGGRPAEGTAGCGSSRGSRCVSRSVTTGSEETEGLLSSSGRMEVAGAGRIGALAVEASVSAGCETEDKDEGRGWIA